MSVDCYSTAEHICSLRAPSCPDGYTWIPETGSSCFKVVTAGSYTDAASSATYSPVQNMEAVCNEEGTRLAHFTTEEEGKALVAWLRSAGTFLDDGSEAIRLFLGMKLTNELFVALAKT